jgi:hypothetical protein
VISWLLSIKGKLFIVSSVAERAVREEFRKLASIKLFDELFKHSELIFMLMGVPMGHECFFKKDSFTRVVCVTRRRRK